MAQRCLLFRTDGHLGEFSSGKLLARTVCLDARLRTQWVRAVREHRLMHLGVLCCHTGEGKRQSSDLWPFFSQHKAMTLAYFYKPRKVHARVGHVSLLTRAPRDAAFTSSCKMMGKGMLPHIWETTFILNRYFRMKKKTLFFFDSNFLKASQNT